MTGLLGFMASPADGEVVIEIFVIDALEGGASTSRTRCLGLVGASVLGIG